MTYLADLSEQPALLAGFTVTPDVTRARAALATHARTRFVGIGSSRHVAGYGAACVEAFAGVPASVSPAPGAGLPVPPVGAGELLVLVSQSGQTPALLDLASTARFRGATVLALTNTPGSPLEGLADLVLSCPAGPETVIPATKSVTSMMLLLRALAGPVRPGPMARLAAVCAELLAADLGGLARTHPLPGIVVAGGMAAEWVADEVALKLAEVTAHLAVPESVVDFLHGPAAVLAATLAFLDPDDPNAAAVSGRADVLTVGPHPGYSLPLQRTGDGGLDPIAQVIAGQCLALAWSREHGIDPNDPRGLRKVTLTR